MSSRGVLALEDGASLEWSVARARGKARATALILPGLGANDLLADDDGLYGALARGLAGEGLDVVRVKRTPEPSSIVDDVETGLLSLQDVAAKRVVIVGHSLGALVAPLVAGPTNALGVVAFGGPARRWADALATSARRQLALTGAAGPDLEREVELAARLYRALLREKVSPKALDPALKGCLAARDLSGDRLHGATLGYLRSVDAIDPLAAYARAKGGLVALQGSFDAVVGEDDAGELARAVVGAGRSAADVRIAGVDHYGREQPSLEAALSARGGHVSPRTIEAIARAANRLLA